MKIKNIRLKKGATLLELLIYVAIFSGIILTIINFYFVLSQSGSGVQARDEVLQNLNFALARLSYDIRRASTITTPQPGNSGNTLSLTIGNETITYQVNNGILERISSTTESITNDKVFVATDTPIFYHFVQGASKSLLTIDLNISYNAQGRPDWVYSQRILTTINNR